ncbi:MAG: hypothetical protein P1P84_26015, partial [Deferrisomatales bacterium]|nr:hypothetical protein [Deferrisomatales bacterium]
MADGTGPGTGFSPLSRHFAAFLEGLAGGSRPELGQAALLVSQAVEAGHVCLDLADPLGPFRGGEDAPGLDVLPAPGPWSEALVRTGVVGEPGAFTPLILDRGRLYLQRYWAYEDRVARFVDDGARRWAGDLDEARLAETLGRLFPGNGLPDDQRVAAVVAAAKPFCVISGGPGTGKTS